MAKNDSNPFNRDVTRRGFLQSSAMAAASSAVTGHPVVDTAQIVQNVTPVVSDAFCELITGLKQLWPLQGDLFHALEMGMVDPDYSDFENAYWRGKVPEDPIAKRAFYQEKAAAVLNCRQAVLDELPKISQLAQRLLREHPQLQEILNAWHFAEPNYERIFEQKTRELIESKPYLKGKYNGRKVHKLHEAELTKIWGQREAVRDELLKGLGFGDDNDHHKAGKSLFEIKKFLRMFTDEEFPLDLHQLSDMNVLRNAAHEYFQREMGGHAWLTKDRLQRAERARERALEHTQEDGKNEEHPTEEIDNSVENHGHKNTPNHGLYPHHTRKLGDTLTQAMQRITHQGHSR